MFISGIRTPFLGTKLLNSGPRWAILQADHEFLFFHLEVGGSLVTLDGDYHGFTRKTYGK